ncbi:MAG TPA: sigma-70 domain-containing protein [Polyangia bacterium]|nr:sigma-70 domain-containing protein [Polyangia bacterium]
MALSSHLQPIFDALKAAHPKGLTLDELAEELIRKPVSYPDIEELIGALEADGIDLEGPGTPARPDELAAVLDAARAFVAERGRRPTVAELAERADLSPILVRRALRLGKSAAGEGS